jgi:hypothetical protein
VSKAPHIPWHEKAGLTPSDLAANLAASRTEWQNATNSERAKNVWWDAFGRARDAGFEPAKAQEIACAEVRLALRKTEPVRENHAPARKPSQVPVGGELVYDPRTDKIARIADADDSTPIASPYDPAREEEHKRFARAEKAHAELIAEETGLPVDGDEWLESKAERQRRRMESHRVANKLELGGKKAYRTDEYQMFICSVFSGHAEQMPNFCRTCIIPEIAAQVRAGKVAALEYFIQCHRYTRFWTFTSGQRVPRAGLRARIQELHKRLNALNKELNRRYGVGLVFRSTELGSLETAESAGKARAKRAAKAAHRKAVAAAKAAGNPVPTWTRAKETQFADDAGKLDRDQTGEVIYHPHAHCLYYSPRGQLPDAEWKEMLRFVWEFWGDHWDEGGLIQDAREACKYVTKSGEMDALSEVELCGLEEALHGLRLVTPLGVLKREIRARKDAGQKLVSRKVDGSRMWLVEDDVNKQLSSSEDDKAQLRAKKKQDRLDRHDATAVITNPVTGEVVSEGMAHTGSLPRRASAAFCRVVSRLAPAAVATPRKEPRVVVIASRGAFDWGPIRRHPLFQGMWEAGAPSWFSEDPIRVHEGTPTGENRVLTLLHDTDERFAPPGEPVWERSKPITPIRSGFDFALN